MTRQELNKEFIKIEEKTMNELEVINTISYRNGGFYITPKNHMLNLFRIKKFVKKRLFS